MKPIVKTRYQCCAIIAFPIFLTGLIIYGIYNNYDEYKGIIINTNYEKKICDCKYYCKEYNIFGCTTFCSNKNNTFECEQQNIIVQIKDNITCNVKNVDKLLSNVNYNLTHTELNYNIGDYYNIYYYNNKCISKENYKSKINCSYMFILFGGIINFNYISILYCKKRTEKKVVIPIIFDQV